MMEQMMRFFTGLWELVLDKHAEGVHNTMCLVVLLTLPLLVFTAVLLVCCHCCCGCLCCRHGDRATIARSPAESKQKKKKKNGRQKEEDLWISMNTNPTTAERSAFTMV
ncbi:hypothetical protein P4O66_002975 [Electrophorus voltai]|uniref:KIAA0040 n=1 Tax=Electrophorus voltai TaxID=2609070 RepID=A0AAD8YUG1_9TELE|nr:hypothetical protein P4O66_002975 [Electrophorus voltai]